MKLEETTPNGLSYMSEILDVSIENKSTTPQKINVFSNMEKKNDNCNFKIYNEEKRYNYVTDMLKSNAMIFSKIRIQVTHVSQLENPIHLIKNELSGKTITRALYPLAHFSAFQFQSGIVDINIPLELDGKTELETQLIEKLHITLLNDKQSTSKFVSENGQEVWSGEEPNERLEWFPISISNPCKDDIEVNLNFNYENMNKYISSANLSNTPLDSRLITTVGDGMMSFHDFIVQMKESERYITFKSIHVIGDIKKLFASLFEYKVGNKITPFTMNETMNPAQFQTQMIEFDNNHPLNNDNISNQENIKFTIPKESKIIFFVTTNQMEK